MNLKMENLLTPSSQLLTNAQALAMQRMPTIVDYNKLRSACRMTCDLRLKAGRPGVLARGGLPNVSYFSLKWVVSRLADERHRVACDPLGCIH